MASRRGKPATTDPKHYNLTSGVTTTVTTEKNEKRKSGYDIECGLGNACRVFPDVMRFMQSNC